MTVEEVVAAHVHTPLTPPNQVVPEVTQPTSEALLCAMAKDPRDRFPSYDELIMALTAARSQLLVEYYRQADAEGRGGSKTGRSWWRR